MTVSQPERQEGSHESENLINLEQLRTEAYLFQVGLQVESLMDRKFLEDLDEIYEVHTHCRWLKKKKKHPLLLRLVNSWSHSWLINASANVLVTADSTEFRVSS